MSEHLYLRSHWGSRKQPIEDCAAHAAKLFDQLAAVDPAFGHWYDSKGTKSPKEALQRKVEPTADALRDLLAKGRNRRDDDKSVIEDLGFRLLLWNGGSQGSGAVVTIHCGAYPHWTLPFANDVWIDLPHDGSVADRVLQAGKLKQVMAAVVGSWDPDVAYVSSDEMWYAAYPPEYKGQKVFGWLTYVSDRYGPLPELPQEYEVTRIGDLGSLIVIAAVDRLTASNPMQVEAVRRLSEILDQAGILAPTSRSI